MLTSKYSHSKRTTQNNITISKHTPFLGKRPVCGKELKWPACRKESRGGARLGRDGASSWQGRMPSRAWRRGWWHCLMPQSWVPGGSGCCMRSIKAGGPWILAPSRLARSEVYNYMDESHAHLQSVSTMKELVGFVPLLGGADKVCRFGRCLRAKP
jgi:hypothetical protein